MPKGKVRALNHILGEQAVRYLQNCVIPSEWIVRQMNPDYGIDLDVEYPPTNPQHTKNGAGQKTSDSKQLQVTMNNSKKLQVTTTYSIKALRSRQPCNNPAKNHSKAAAE